MVGDTNLFLKEVETEQGVELLAEVEIMVAEKLEREKKLGFEALCLMINYGITKLRVKQFEAKIKFDNAPSISLFEKLGFRESSRSAVFSEITYNLASSKLNDFQTQISFILKNSRTIEYLNHH